MERKTHKKAEKKKNFGSGKNKGKKGFFNSVRMLYLTVFFEHTESIDR